MSSRRENTTPASTTFRHSSDPWSSPSSRRRSKHTVAPSIVAVRVVALRSLGPDSYGKPQIDVLLAARIQRNALDGIEWERAEASAIVSDAAGEVVFNISGQAKELQPIDLTGEPELVALLSHVDVSDLADA